MTLLFSQNPNFPEYNWSTIRDSNGLFTRRPSATPKFE